MRRAGIGVAVAVSACAALWWSGGAVPPTEPPTEPEQARARTDPRRSAATAPAAGAVAAPAPVERGASPPDGTPQPTVLWRGQLVDEKGQPLFGAVVRSRSGTVARAGNAGWFALAAPPSPSDVLLFTAPARAPRAVPCAELRAGEQVVLQPAGLVSVEVVDAGTGERVDAYTAQLVGATDAELRADAVQLPSRPGGALLEARVAVESPALLRVLPDEERFAPSLPRTIELDAVQPQTVRVELCAWGELTVQVADRSGAPMVGALVEVMARPDGRRCEVDTLAVTDWRAVTPSRAALWFRSVTDARGRLRVRAPSRGPFTVRASHADGGCEIERGVELAAVPGGALQFALAR